MGKTYKRNDRWKKDLRDQNFRNSKKFKEFKHDYQVTKPNLPTTIDSEPTEIDDNVSDNS